MTHFCRLVINAMQQNKWGLIFMKNVKLIRNIYIFCGLCFLLATFLQLAAGTTIIVPILNGVTCILMFIVAYINHKKVIKGNKNKDKKQ